MVICILDSQCIHLIIIGSGFSLTYVLFIPFFIFGHFWQRSYENIKILRNLCLHFGRQDGQDGKKEKENHATKVTKIPKTKRRKYWMNKTVNCVKIFSLDCRASSFGSYFDYGLFGIKWGDRASYLIFFSSTCSMSIPNFG